MVGKLQSPLQALEREYASAFALFDSINLCVALKTSSCHHFVYHFEAEFLAEFA